MNVVNDSSNIIRQYARSIFRHKGKLIAYNILIALLAVAVILVWPREYQSEAKIWIKLGRENSKLDPTAATGETISIQETDREDEIKSVIDIIGSRGVAEQAVDQLGPLVVLGDEPLPGAEEEDPVHPIAESIKNAFGSAIDLVKQIDPLSDREEAVQEIVKHIEVDAERKSNVVAVSYETDSPELAQAIVDAIIDQYISQHQLIHQTVGSTAFFGKQLDTLKERVDQRSAELRQAKDDMGLASIDGHRKFLEAQISQIGASRLVAAQKVAETKALSMELTNQLDKQPATIKSEEKQIPNTGRDTLVAQLQQVQIQRAELQSRQRNHPELRAMISQERRLKGELAKQSTKSRSETTQALNVVHQEIAMELAQVKAKAAGHQATLDQLQQQERQAIDQIKGLNEAEINIYNLERQVNLAVKAYTSYAENMEDARMDEELNDSPITNVSIAQAPTLEEKPVSPSKLVVAALTIAAMFFGSLVIVASMLMIDDSVHRLEDIEEIIDTPIVVSVPNQREYRHVLN